MRMLALDINQWPIKCTWPSVTWMYVPGQSISTSGYKDTRDSAAVDAKKKTEDYTFRRHHTRDAETPGDIYIPGGH